MQGDKKILTDKKLSAKKKWKVKIKKSKFKRDGPQGTAPLYLLF